MRLGCAELLGGAVLTMRSLLTCGCSSAGQIAVRSSDFPHCYTSELLHGLFGLSLLAYACSVGVTQISLDLASQSAIQERSGNDGCFSTRPEEWTQSLANLCLTETMQQPSFCVVPRNCSLQKRARSGLSSSTQHMSMRYKYGNCTLWTRTPLQPLKTEKAYNWTPREEYFAVQQLLAMLVRHASEPMFLIRSQKEGAQL